MTSAEVLQATSSSRIAPDFVSSLGSETVGVYAPSFLTPRATI